MRELLEHREMHIASLQRHHLYNEHSVRRTALPTDTLHIMDTFPITDTNPPLQSITPPPTTLVCHSHTHHSAAASLRGLLITRYGMEIVWSGWAGFFLFLWISTSVCRLAPLYFFSCIETYLQNQSTKGGRGKEEMAGGRGNGREREWEVLSLVQ